MAEETYFYHPLENIEDIDIFEEAVERKKFVKTLSNDRPYTYWTIELYDQDNGIRGGGGLGILAADTRRVAEQMNVPFALITPFYPQAMRQVMKNGSPADEIENVNYHDYGYKYVDSVNVKCCDNLCKLDVIYKKLGSTKIICITEPNFRFLYADMSGSDHRLYQEVCLGFGGYQALKLLGIKPAVIQLNEVATYFAALARLDELVKNGMDFYEAVVYVRKHTLYTNHTLVQAAEAEFSYDQFEKFVFPNVQSAAVKKWLSDKFTNGKLKLSSAAVEIAELKSSVSKLHARVSDYKDVAGNKVKFKPITNGIDINKWVMPELVEFYQSNGILDETLSPTMDYAEKLEKINADRIREFKKMGRGIMNSILSNRPNQNGDILHFNDDDFIFVFKRRFVDYKRPELPFSDLGRLREVLESANAHYILTGRIHTGDVVMMAKLQSILDAIKKDDYLKTHVHYIADYDEKLAYALAVGCNVSLNLPIVGLEACGTSWMKDVANLSLLISTHDGGVADVSKNYCLSVNNSEFDSELDAIYQRMAEAIAINESDFDLEVTLRLQLAGYLPIISGTRMLKEYLEFLF